MGKPRKKTVVVSEDPEIVAAAHYDVLVQLRLDNPDAFAAVLLKLQADGLVRAPLAFLA